MTESKFEVGKYYRRGDGELIRVVCVDAPGGYPVIGYLADGEVLTYKSDGEEYTDCHPDYTLIPTPVEPKKKGMVWVHVDSGGGITTFKRKEIAETAPSLPFVHTIARVRVEWTEGQFDE